MGTVHKKTAEKDTSKYRRAYSPKNRNRIWNGIVKKTPFDVEILWETNEKNEIFLKEKEFISLYGRVDKKNGTLANMTSGGDGSTELSEISIRETVKKNRQNGCFERCGIFLSNRNRTFGSSWKGRQRPSDYSGNKKTFAYSNSDGVFIGEFENRRLAALFFNIRGKQLIPASIRKNTSCKGVLFFDKYKGEKVPIVNDKSFKPVYKIDVCTLEVVKEFISVKEAAEYENAAISTFITHLKTDGIYNNHLWRYKK